GFVDGEFRGKLRYLRANLLFDFGVADVRDDVGDPVADLFHFRLTHSASGDRRSTEANTTRFHWGQGIERDRILVDGDARSVEGPFRIAAGNAARVNFDQKQMIICAAGDDAETALGDSCSHGFRICDDLLLIFDET